MSCLFPSGSCELLTLAVTLACLLARDQDEDQLGRMAAFFTILGDTLALFALQPGLAERCSGRCFSKGEDPGAPQEAREGQAPK